MKEPFSWFLESPALAAILPKEAADKEGLFKSPETVIGTGPWMLERYEPNVRLSFVRNPHYFQQGLPYLDAIEFRVDTDPASKLAAWLSGQYDFAPEIHMTFQRSDLEVVKRRKPNLQTAEYTWLISTFAIPKLEAEPLRDVRVRRALHMAVNLTEVIKVNPMGYGHGSANPLVPAALTEWAIPIGQLTPEGRQLYEADPAGARRLLAQAGQVGAQVPRGVVGDLGPRLLRRRAGHSQRVEAGGHRDGAEAERGQRVHCLEPGPELREDDHHAAGRGDDARPLPDEPPARGGRRTSPA